MTVVSAAGVHALLREPGLVGKRLGQLAGSRLIGDQILTGRFDAVGGAIVVSRETSTGEPERLAPLAEYPLEVIEDGDPLRVETSKWGLSALVSDEDVARMRIDPLDRALRGLADSLVRRTDDVSLGVVGAVLAGQTREVDPWTDAAAITAGVLEARAAAESAGTGVFDTVLLSPAEYAGVMVRLIAAGVLPRETTNPLLAGPSSGAAELFGMTWLRSPAWTLGPALIDRAGFGGIATENLGGAGWAAIPDAPGAEVHVERLTGRDGWLLRVRRVFAPVIIDPAAGVLLSGAFPEAGV